MKKILITSIIATSIIFIGCGSSSSSTPDKKVVTDPDPVVNVDVNKTEDNKTVVKVPTIPEIDGTTVIGNVRFTNLVDATSKLPYEAAKQECETFVATDGSGGWKLPTIDQLLLLLSDDENKTINESVVPVITPDPDKPDETSHTSAIWSDTISINADNNESDPDYRDALFLAEKRVITQDIVDSKRAASYYTVCVKDVNTTN